MAQYRIICTLQVSVNQPHSHAHIAEVGTGPTIQQYNRKWTVAEVYTAMDQGDIFYTTGEQSEKTAIVNKYKCPHCNSPTLRSAADAVADNNLDNLPRCG